MIDINELRRLAQAATPGPWEFWHGMIATDIDNDGGVVIAKRPTPSGGKLQARVDANFQHIVADNPAASLELLDRLEAAETAWKVSDKSLHDLTEKVIPNLRDQLEAAEMERDTYKVAYEEWIEVFCLDGVALVELYPVPVERPVGRGRWIWSS